MCKISKSLIALALAAGMIAAQSPAMALVKGRPGATANAAGGACTVVSGPNAGKKGTYDDEGWCMGPWGGTECTTNGQDNGKCKAGKVAVLSPKIYTAPVLGGLVTKY